MEIANDLTIVTRAIAEIDLARGTDAPLCAMTQTLDAARYLRDQSTVDEIVDLQLEAKEREEARDFDGVAITPGRAVVVPTDDVLTFGAGLQRRDVPHRFTFRIDRSTDHSAMPQRSENAPDAVGVGDQLRFANDGRNPSVIHHLP